MTPPRPTAPTAAELREATIQMHCDSGGCDSVRGGPPGSHDSVGCHLAGMLDDLMAAVRAEVLEEAAKVADRFGVEWRLYGHVTESIAARIRALVHR